MCNKKFTEMKDLDLFNIEYEGTKKPDYAIIVDAATSGNPGLSKYRGIIYPEKKVLFEKSIGYSTNNVTEFIALIHGLAYSIENGLNAPVYTDSKTAIAWIKSGINTSLKPSPKTKIANELLRRAKLYREKIRVKENIDYYLWETREWGENPADYGNK